MPLFPGGIEVDDVKLGSAQVSSIWQGVNLVWPVSPTEITTTEIFHGPSIYTSLDNNIVNGLRNTQIFDADLSGGIMMSSEGKTPIFTSDYGDNWADITKPEEPLNTVPFDLDVAAITYSLITDSWFMIVSSTWSNLTLGRECYLFHSEDEGANWSEVDHSHAGAPGSDYLLNFNWAYDIKDDGVLLWGGLPVSGPGRAHSIVSYTSPTTSSSGLRFQLVNVGANAFTVRNIGSITYQSRGDFSDMMATNLSTINELYNTQDVSYHGWADDNLKLITPSSTSNSAGLYLKWTGGDAITATELVTVSAGSVDKYSFWYGDNKWVLAWVSNNSSLKDKIYIKVSSTGEPGTWSETITLTLGRDRNFDDIVFFREFFNIIYIGNSLWAIWYLSDVDEHVTLATFPLGDPV